MQNNEQLKPLPLGPTKAQLHKMYWNVPTEVLKLEINRAIRKHRNIPQSTTIYNRTLLLPEFKILIEFLGYPKGYEKEFRQ